VALQDKLHLTGLAAEQLPHPAFNILLSQAAAAVEMLPMALVVVAVAVVVIAVLFLESQVAALLEHWNLHLL
jgi:hypothetical protein